MMTTMTTTPPPTKTRPPTSIIDHSEIHARYQFTCATPTALSNLDLSQVFKAFPATRKFRYN